jgi:hypothetical protein
VRYVVRDERGEELTCPSLADLHALYRQGLVGEDDLVRAERSDRWVRAGDFPPLRGERARRAEPRQMLLVLAAAAALGLGIWLLLRGR